MKVIKQISFGGVVIITSLAFVVAQLDVSIVNLALPQIARSYGAGISTLQWVVDAYTLVFAVLMLSAGSLSDRLGALRIFQAGILIFGVASVGCGLADSSLVLVVFRVLQGVGAATMIPSSLSLLNQAFAHEPAIRTRAVGLWTAAGSAALAIGPLIGGVLIHLSNWRFIFYVNIPFCVAAFLLSFKLDKGSVSATAKRFDLAGQLVWMLAATLLIASIIEWHEFGFHNPMIWGGLLLSVVLFFLFPGDRKACPPPYFALALICFFAFQCAAFIGRCAERYLLWERFCAEFIFTKCAALCRDDGRAGFCAADGGFCDL